MHVNDPAVQAVECVTIAVSELSDMRDLDDSKLHFIMDMLCTKQLTVYSMTLDIIHFLLFSFTDPLKLP